MRHSILIAALLVALLVILCGLLVTAGLRQADITPGSEFHHESQKLFASDCSMDARFGMTIAVSDGMALVGAPLDTGLQRAAGAVYVFSMSDGIWERADKLCANTDIGKELFGASLAISGRTAIIGAPASGDSEENSGAAYVFHYADHGKWKQVARLTASDAAVRSDFGRSVALSDNVAIVGSPRSGQFGSAYVYQCDATGKWNEICKLTARDLDLHSCFGGSVAIFGQTAFVGAYGDGTAGARSGAVYVFRCDRSGNWIQVAKLTPSDAAPFSWFGWSLAADGQSAVVGAYADSGAAPFGGAAYVFQCDQAGIWRQTAKLTTPDAVEGERFGYSVAIGGRTIVIGSPVRNNCAGAAHLFALDKTGVWKHCPTLMASDSAEHDWFGRTVAISGDQVFVGAHKRDDAAPNSGSAYLFHIDRAMWSGNTELKTELD